MSLVLHGGHGKSLFVSRDSIRIVWEQQAERHDKGIPIRNIASVQVKKPGAFDGFIQFSIAGGKAHDHGFSFTGGSFDASRDENSVTFNGMDEYDVALKIKVYIEAWSPAGTHAAEPSQAPLLVADEVRKLKALLDEGVLTPDEFAAKKKQLLA